MSMPKAAMHKNYGFEFEQNDVGFSREVFSPLSLWRGVGAEAVSSKTKAFGEKKFTYQHFRAGVLSFNPAHVIASGFFTVYISHRYFQRGSFSQCDFKPRALESMFGYFVSNELSPPVK